MENNELFFEDLKVYNCSEEREFKNASWSQVEGIHRTILLFFKSNSG